MSFQTLLYIRQAYSRMTPDYVFHRAVVAYVSTCAYGLCHRYLGGIDVIEEECQQY